MTTSKTRFRLEPAYNDMGKILVDVSVSNTAQKSKKLKFQALIDTAATFLTLPTAWKSKLGKLEVLDNVELELASGQVVASEICGPVTIKIENFRHTVGEVLFIDMMPDDNGEFEPLIGYLPLEAIPRGIDMLNHCLVKVNAKLK